MHRFGLIVTLLTTAATLAYAASESFHYDDRSAQLGPDSSIVGTSTTDVNLVDVDGDGDLDVFLVEGTDRIDGRPNRLLINDGTGNFVDESAVRLPVPNNQNSTIADFGDVDGDGDLDAIIGGVLGEELLLNNGSGTFIRATTQIPQPIINPSLNRFDITAEARLLDVDGDSDLDILLANENPFNPSPTSGDQNRLWINDGTGNFTDDTMARLPDRTDQTGAIIGGDIDGDGDIDLIVLNRGQDFVLINADGLGHFVDETAARLPITTDTSRGGALGDVDGDGDLDYWSETVATRQPLTIATMATAYSPSTRISTTSRAVPRPSPA